MSECKDVNVRGPVRLVVSVVVVAVVAGLGWALMPKGSKSSPAKQTGATASGPESATKSAAASHEQGKAEPVSAHAVREPFVAGRLLVGDPAPALSIQRWYIGEPRERLEPGFVHVVDLWATWCGPCVRAMPELTALQAEYKGKGLRVLGVSIDEAKNAEEQVENFIEKRRETIGFDIALDDGRTVQDWLAAAGRSSIPSSYVVDQHGTVAWIGHPEERDAGSDETRMERVISELLDGTFDLEAATAEARQSIEKDRAAQADAERVQVLMDEMGQAWAEGDRDKAIDVIDRIVAMDAKAGAELAVRKAEILLYELGRTEEATAFVVEMIQGPYIDDAETLLRFSSLLSGDLDPGPDGRQAAVAAAELAVGVVGDDPSVLAQLGHAQFVAGEVDEAIETMTRARDLCDEESGMYGVLDDLVDEYQRAND